MSEDNPRKLESLFESQFLETCDTGSNLLEGFQGNFFRTAMHHELLVVAQR